MGSVQVVAIDVLPHAAKIISLDFGFRFVKRTRLEAGDETVRINKELNMGWEG